MVDAALASFVPGFDPGGKIDAAFDAEFDIGRQAFPDELFVGTEFEAGAFLMNIEGMNAAGSEPDEHQPRPDSHLAPVPGRDPAELVADHLPRRQGERLQERRHGRLVRPRD